jgi:hypothetical protein
MPPRGNLGHVHANSPFFLGKSAAVDRASALGARSGNITFLSHVLWKTGDTRTGQEDRQARFCSAARSASTIISTNWGKRTLGSQPRTLRALEASPTRRSTSAGRS